MPFNTFTSGVNTTFSDELDENFDLSTANFVAARSFREETYDMVSLGNDLENKPIALNPNIEYYIDIRAEQVDSSFSLNASGGDVQTTSDITSSLQGKISWTTNAYGRPLTLAVSDGNTDLTIFSDSTGTNEIHNNQFSGSFIHNPENYLYIRGERENKEEELNNDQPFDTYLSEDYNLDVSTLNTPYYFKAITESGDYDSEIDFNASSLNSSSTKSTVKEYSLDGGSTWVEFGQEGVFVENESSIQVRVNNGNASSIIVKPLI